MGQRPVAAPAGTAVSLELVGATLARCNTPGQAATVVLCKQAVQRQINLERVVYPKT